MKRIIYNKSTGEIIVKTESYQEINTLFSNETKEYRNELDSIIIKNPPKNLRRYVVENGGLVQRGRG